MLECGGKIEISVLASALQFIWNCSVCGRCGFSVEQTSLCPDFSEKVGNSLFGVNGFRSGARFFAAADLQLDDRCSRSRFVDRDYLVNLVERRFLNRRQPAAAGEPRERRNVVRKMLCTEGSRVSRVKSLAADGADLRR